LTSTLNTVDNCIWMDTPLFQNYTGDFTMLTSYLSVDPPHVENVPTINGEILAVGAVGGGPYLVHWRPGTKYWTSGTHSAPAERIHFIVSSLGDSLNPVGKQLLKNVISMIIPATLSPSVSSLTLNKNAQQVVTFTWSRTPQRSVSITVTPPSGVTLQGASGAGIPLNVTFASGSTTAQVTVLAGSSDMSGSIAWSNATSYDPGFNGTGAGSMSITVGTVTVTTTSTASTTSTNAGTTSTNAGTTSTNAGTTSSSGNAGTTSSSGNGTAGTSTIGTTTKTSTSEAPSSAIYIMIVTLLLMLI